MCIDSNCCVRQYCGPARPFHMAILDNNQREVCQCIFSLSYNYLYVPPLFSFPCICRLGFEFSLYVLTHFLCLPRLVFVCQVIHLDRPLRCSCWCCFCCLQKVEVQSPPGTVIGYVEQVSFFFLEGDWFCWLLF